MESYLSQRIEEQNRRYEALHRLHGRLTFIVNSFGGLVDPADPDNDAMTTPHIPLVEGWEVAVYRPSSEDEIQDELTDPVQLFLSPTTGENNEFTLHYLRDGAEIWIAVGTEDAFDETTEVSLTTKEIEALFNDVFEVIEPALIQRRDS